MSRVSETPEKRNGTHSVVVHEVARVEEQPRVDEDEIGPVELSIGRIQIETLVVKSVWRERGGERERWRRERGRVKVGG